MYSTTKTCLAAFLFFTCIALTNGLHAQKQIFINQLKEVSKRINIETAAIKINNKDASYADLLQIPDSALLKAEVYPKKEAAKLWGKEEGKNGVILIKLRKGIMFQADSTRKRGNYLYNDNGDSIYCAHLTPATLGGDTTHKNWNQFLAKKLGASVPVENECPPGIYNVDFSFTINKDGAITTVKIFEDPGYGCGGEVRRLMKQSPVWTVGMCEEEPINYVQRQRIIFFVTER
ncbi:hypothetical protein [Foetidibacter luteolus]|uniref:hypothetical protein n=1 Tax=Foetidibacter luteolus TaxID=2608880 RepID=UPI00129A8C93|nr:hypothetical protein [Foetidibacter luteolus]